MKVQITSLAFASILLTACGGGSSAPPIAANQPGDANLTCEQITGQINEMNELLGIAQGDMRSADTMGLTTDLAVQAAVSSGALSSLGGSVPFLGSAINAAGAMNNASRAAAEERAEQAVNRRNVLTGIYAGKGCDNM